MNPLWHGILGFVMVILGVIGWAGNGVVVYIFCSTKVIILLINYITFLCNTLGSVTVFEYTYHY